MPKKLVISAALAIALLFVSQSRADFLGLSPGNYTVTLIGSASLCGGSDCTGTVHIGSPGATDFDWDFTIDGDLFEFDGPTTDTSISPNTLTSCALEVNDTAGGCQAFDDGTTTIAAPLSPNFAMDRLETAGLRWFYVGDVHSGRGTWDASPVAVPEPWSSSLLLFGLSALGLRRWFRVNQDCSLLSKKHLRVQHRSGIGLTGEYQTSLTQS
jgi:hypothetical protein